MAHLSTIWDQIGIFGDQRLARKGVVLLHMRNLLDEMVREEDLLKSRLMDNVEKFSAELLGISKELGLSIYEVQIGLSTLRSADNLLFFLFI